MAMPEGFKFDVRVRERLLRKGELTEAEIEKHQEGLADTSANSLTIELKQPAFQTEAERAENAVVVRAAPPRPITLAAPINLDEEDDEDDEEELQPKKAVAKVEAPEKLEKSEKPAAVVKADDADEDDEDEDDEDEDEDGDDEDDEDEEGDEDEDEDEGEGEEKEEASDSDKSGADS